mmetsp:Transcript_23925/g.36373  ORF Transcript_23925/g.36373 Transcript_23925/m.36373 type:complete len:80 (+) Transcript_23925:1143-1382(+)
MGICEAVEKAVTDIKEAFNITTQGTLDDYLGCKFTLDARNKTMYIMQPHLMEKMLDKFGPELPRREYLTPGTPRYTTRL